jgi:hypothetical protein
MGFVMSIGLLVAKLASKPSKLDIDIPLIPEGKPPEYAPE